MPWAARPERSSRRCTARWPTSVSSSTIPMTSTWRWDRGLTARRSWSSTSRRPRRRRVTMRLVDLRTDLDDLARAQPDPDHDGGRRSVAGRVRRHRRRTRLTSLAAVIVIVVVGAMAISAGGADRPRVDVGVTSGLGPFPHLVPGYVPGGLTPAYETFDSAGHQIQ